MPRRIRVASGGYAYHVLNRAVGRARIFDKQRDFEAFEEVIGQAKERVPMRVLAWCVLSNHWHFVLWPQGDDTMCSARKRKRSWKHCGVRWSAAHPLGNRPGRSERRRNSACNRPSALAADRGRPNPRDNKESWRRRRRPPLA